ncbi:type II secretion system protein GspL [Psychrobium sp. 1_MG-2023]|uniref:type II secretion system protein GspL n=1 Tax=Psychrobium sp. 1_MG-2023 TaxID=3062624 RepID=UPI000C336644|nr:type II secretion system protein GspL [Psychrobium sp. 1_MG-2023]MDP2561939.1 type II secretion system protein GspL [Psychrobium sp. 1_MG-2023]PKF58678.1 type II secretion system protein GspL [Alteromonadales bacterium alter-6D02]
MSERLVIRLGGQQQQPVNWVVFSDKDQEIIASGQLNDAAELDNLTEQAKGRTVQVLVSGGEVNYFEVELPKSNRRQALKAIPYMLEDDLATDVELLHFVYPPAEGDKQGVYVCAKQQMVQWVDWLAQAGLVVNSMSVDYLALPYNDNAGLSALQLGQDLLFRQTATQGCTIDLQWSDVYIQRITAPLEAEQRLQVANYGVDQVIESDKVDWQAQTLQMPMQLLACGIQANPVNFLVDEYAQEKEQPITFQLWRHVAVVGVIALLLIFVEQFFRAQKLEQQSVQLKQQSEEIYRQLNPGVKRVIKLKSQMRKQLGQLSGGSGDMQLSNMLVTLNKAFKQVPTIKPASIKFDARRKELRLQAEGDSYQQLEEFKRVLVGEYSVTSGAMNNTGSKVTAALTMKVAS